MLRIPRTDNETPKQQALLRQFEYELNKELFDIKVEFQEKINDLTRRVEELEG